jgi:predicted ABC-type ATPase
MNNIFHPETGELYSIFSNHGKRLLKRYIKIYQNGGSGSESPPPPLPSPKISPPIKRKNSFSPITTKKNKKSSPKSSVALSSSSAAGATGSVDESTWEGDVEEVGKYQYTDWPMKELNMRIMAKKYWEESSEQKYKDANEYLLKELLNPVENMQSLKTQTQQPTAILAFGPAGAGKSYILNNHLSTEYDFIKEKQYIDIDPDYIRSRMLYWNDKVISDPCEKNSPCYNKWTTPEKCQGRTPPLKTCIPKLGVYLATGPEYNKLYQNLINKSINENYNIINTSGQFTKLRALANKLLKNEKGYEVIYLLVVTTLEQVLENARERNKKEGRYTSEEYARKSYIGRMNDIQKVLTHAKKKGITLKMFKNENNDVELIETPGDMIEYINKQLQPSKSIMSKGEKPEGGGAGK